LGNADDGEKSCQPEVTWVPVPDGSFGDVTATRSTLVSARRYGVTSKENSPKYPSWPPRW
jgi:hypothetical protein